MDDHEIAGAREVVPTTLHAAAAVFFFAKSRRIPAPVPAITAADPVS